MAGKIMLIRKKAGSDYTCTVPDSILAEKLTPLQFAVTRTGATERPFQNEYWDNHERGIYVDVIDGTPLFASSAKFESGSGWPSFWAPIDPEKIELVEDRAFGMRRIEVRSKSSGSHLGHLFDDGPEPTGMRYCMNSASLRFIPMEEMANEGLEGYARLFE